MSCFLVLPHGDVVGYSVWPFDPLYRPVVGLFDDMKLVGHAICHLKRPGRPRIPGRLLLRVARRLGLLERLLVPVPLEGPSDDYWFSMSPGPTLSARLRRGDPTLRLARLEDGAELTLAGRKITVSAGPRTVEQLLQLPDGTASTSLDGFPWLLQAPYEHQLEVVYLDVLGRAPDENAYRDYQPELESRTWSAADLRRTLLASEEFRLRPLTSNDRVGAFTTSRLWKSLSEARVPGCPPRPHSEATSRLQEA